MNKGITHTTLDKPFQTESGFTFKNAEAAYKTWGSLNRERNNVVLICHALTGHAAADEWFSGIFGKGKICDPETHFILCINVPGSPYGSVGPWSRDPATGQPYRERFPEITIRDMVRFQQKLLDQLGIRGIELVIGGSLGGMQALEFLVMDERVDSAALIAMGKAHSPWAIGISHAQRTALLSDPEWKNGRYKRGEGPKNGLAAARMMAMITYRSPNDYERKFSRNRQTDSPLFEVESYLDYQGQKLAERFDAHSYIILTKAMDTHDVSRDRESFEEVLNQIEKPVRVIGFDSDHLYPTHEQKELASLLGNADYLEISSPYGHDAFLIEFDQLNELIIPLRTPKNYQDQHHVTT
ncbi:MAG: homoserine O-acetyltransferase [Bacteroidetes bacterium]|jgi:homoserine O-acetyltransferase|nr:homoserine O-acetyltransferase [Bacteroidota bacterium]